MKKPNTVYLGTFNTNEHGESPFYAKLELTPEFLARVEELRKLITNHELSSISVESLAGLTWDSANKDIRLDGDQLVVSAYFFWFETWVKHQDGHVETRLVDFTRLAKLAASEQGTHYGSHDYGGDTPNEFIAGCVERETQA